MNGRSGLTTFFLFLLLAVMILFQILSMIQADRLYERLNTLIDRWQSSTPVRTTAQNNPDDPTNDRYPGDEGDWLVWHLDAEPATLNPITRRDAYAQWVVEGNVFEGLLQYDLDTLELKKSLAADYSVSDDGLEIYYRLRDDVHFSDGHPITADDVIFTYRTIINPGIDCASLANYYQDIKRVEKISDLEVKFYMKKPYFKSLEFTGGMTVLPKHIYEFSDPQEFNNRRSEPVGSGPYVFEKWDVGQQIILRRNENYWGPKPKLKKLVFRIITNEVAALQALRSHQIDLMLATSEQFVELQQDPQFQKEFESISYWDPTRGYSYIGWNYASPFFSDKRVRLAMTHLVDRQAIVTHLAKGLARIVTGPFYLLGPQNNPDIKPWPYDPAEAARLLDEAGWVDTDGDGLRDKDDVPFRFELMTPSGSDVSEKVAKLLKDDMAKVGIELLIDPYEWSVFEEKLNKRDFDATTLAWGGTIEDDPYQIWHSSQIKGRGSNRIGFANAEADALIEEARRTLDPNQRNKLFHKFHDILHQEQPYTFMYTTSWKYFLDKRFENVKIHKLGLDQREWYVPKNEQRYK